MKPTDPLHTSITPLLLGCELSVASVSPHLLRSLESSLLSQSTSLGFQTTQHTSDANIVGFELAFKTPRTSRVKAFVTPWQQDKQRVASEYNIQATCGMMSVHGRSQGQAQLLPLPYISTLTACLALQGVMASSLGQLRGVDVVQSDVSMLAAGLLSMGQYIAGATAVDGAENILPSHFLATNQPPFVSADNMYFELETLSPEPWKCFWQHVGISGLVAGKGWSSFLMRYAKAAAPLPDELKAALKKLPYAQIQQYCDTTGVSICTIRSREQRQTDADIYALNNPELEKKTPRYFKAPWHFNERQTNVYKKNKTQPASTKEEILPLSGIVVVEACRRIQGPMSGHILALLGATVIRIEPPGGDPLRGMPPTQDGTSVRFDALNRLKRIVEIDLKTAAGQQHVLDLIRDADVFVHNWAPGKAAEFSLDLTDMQKINPHLIYAYAGGWGLLDTQQNLPGTDFMVQAFSGISEQISTHGQKTGGSLFTVLDILGGVVSSQGIVAALLARELSGDVARVDTSLLDTADLLSTTEHHYLTHINGMYPTANGHIMLDGITDENLGAFTQKLGLTSTANTKTDIEKRFLKKTTHDWVHCFYNTQFAVTDIILDLSELAHQSEIKACITQTPHTYTHTNSPWAMQRNHKE